MKKLRKIKRNLYQKIRPPKLFYILGFQLDSLLGGECCFLVYGSIFLSHYLYELFYDNLYLVILGI